MNYYTPDHWVIIRVGGNNPHFRVLAGWYGGYLGSDNWRMNSGIVKCIEENDHWLFIGSSGSTYACHKECYKLSMKTTGGIWNQLVSNYGDKVELLEDRDDWSEFDWGKN